MHDVTTVSVYEAFPHSGAPKIVRGTKTMLSLVAACRVSTALRQLKIEGCQRKQLHSHEPATVSLVQKGVPIRARASNTKANFLSQLFS